MRGRLLGGGILRFLTQGKIDLTSCRAMIKWIFIKLCQTLKERIDTEHLVLSYIQLVFLDYV